MKWIIYGLALVMAVPAFSSGLREGELRMLREIEEKEAEQRRAKQYARERDARHYIGYAERNRLRELRMERDSLMKQIDRGHLSYGEASAYRERIRTIDLEMSRIQAPKW